MLLMLLYRMPLLLMKAFLLFQGLIAKIVLENLFLSGHVTHGYFTVSNKHFFHRLICLITANSSSTARFATAG